MRTRVPQLSWLATAVGLTVAVTASAHAQGTAPRVALVDPGSELEAAARAALEPWGIELAIVPGPSPGATAPESNAAARALASAHGVSAVVWVSVHEGGYALWVYDLATHHVIERALATGPPFDGATAAAVALSVKTLLRHSAAAPPQERYGASSAAAPIAPLPARSEPGPAREAPTAVPADRGADRDDSEPDEALAASAARPLAPPLVELALAGGVRLAATRPGTVEPRFGLAASWWPERGPFGVEAGASAGPAVSVRDAAFEGSLFDAAGSLGLALRHDFARRVRAQAAIVGALHVLVLDGSLTQDEQAASATRATPSLALRVRGDWALSARLRLGLFAALGYVLRAERYLVEERTIFELSHLGVETGLALSFGLGESATTPARAALGTPCARPRSSRCSAW